MRGHRLDEFAFNQARGVLSSAFARETLWMSRLVLQSPALDGEREVEIQLEQRLQIRVGNAAGPRVVDVPTALRQAAERGFSIRRTEGAKF
jgi:hypothetical protein